MNVEEAEQDTRDGAYDVQVSPPEQPVGRSLNPLHASTLEGEPELSQYDSPPLQDCPIVGPAGGPCVEVDVTLLVTVKAMQEAVNGA